MADPSITEPIFIARTATELDRAAELLDAHGIAFVTRPELFLASEGCLMEGVAFSVLRRQAAFCRDVLADHGLARGVLAGSVEEAALTGVAP